MAVDIQEKKAMLEVSHFNDGYTEGLNFDFALPVSGDYEVEFNEMLACTEEYPKYFSTGIEVKYSQGMLYLHMECQDEEGFELRVKDAEHSYKATCHGSEEALAVWKSNGIYNAMVKQIETEGMDVSTVE